VSEKEKEIFRLLMGREPREGDTVQIIPFKRTGPRKEGKVK